MSHSLKYHQATFDFLGERPVFSQKQHDALKALERYLNVQLPESFLEWFSLENAESYIALIDDVLPVSRFRVNVLPGEQQSIIEPDSMRHWRNRDKYHLDKNLLVFIEEHQRAFEWAIDLHGRADPRVWRDWFGRGQRWVPCSETFSQFVFSRVWDYEAMLSDNAFEANMRQHLTFADLAQIDAQYDLLYKNHSNPGFNQTNYCFQKDHKLIWIAQWERGSHVFASARTLQALEELLQDLSEVNDLSHQMKHRNSGLSVIEFLERIRAEK